VEITKSGGIAVVVNADNPVPPAVCRSLPCAPCFWATHAAWAVKKPFPAIHPGQRNPRHVLRNDARHQRIGVQIPLAERRFFPMAFNPRSQMQSSADLLDWVRRTPNAVAVVPARDALNKKGEPWPGLAVVLVIR
jgi:hypothetical protein